MHVCFGSLPKSSGKKHMLPVTTVFFTYTYLHIQIYIYKCMFIYVYVYTLRIQVCPKNGITPIILLWGWD